MNVLKFGRKVLTVGTVFSTILWSVGVSALVPAMAQAQTSCPAFQPGDMIKVVGHPAIYSVDANGKVLYFPSGDEFKSWNTGETYGGYTAVSQSCFDSLPVPTSAPLGVNFRPGSFVVKRPSSDQIYVVEPGNMLATITTDAAKALYGASYKVKTVADVFWPNYGNNRGTPVTSAVAHPGMLVSNGGNTYYVDSTGALRQVTAAGFTANRFKQAFVHPVASIAGYSMGAQLTSAESGVADRTQTNASPTPTPINNASVNVSLASDNPAGTVLASGTAFNPVLKLNLTAGSQDVSITGLTVRKSGLAANNSVSGADVIDSSGVRHGNVAATLTSDNDLQLLFSSNPIVVRAGTTQTVTVRVNIGASGTSGTLQFSVLGTASITGASASGNFPVTGNTFTLQDGSNAIGAVTATVTNVGTSTLSVDTTNEQDITKFTLTSSNSLENVLVKSFALYNNGTAADTDVQDVQLVSQEGTVLATAQQVSKVVTFNLVTPYSIDKGTAKTFTIRAKVVNGAGRTINFTVYNNYDIGLQGATTGANLIASGTFPLGTGLNTMTVGSGSLSFNKDVSSPSTAITPGANSVVLAKFYAKPTGEDMELRQVTLGINSSTPVLTGSLVIKVNGSSVWSGSGTGFGTSTVTLSTYPIIPAGQNSYITVEGSIMSLVGSGANVTASLDINQVRRVLTNDIIDPAVNTAFGNQLTVQSAALKVTTLATPPAQSVVVGTNAVTLANFEFNAGAVSSGEDVKVSSFVVNDTQGAGHPEDIGNLVLYDANGNALATSNSTVVNATNTTFNLINPITVPKSGSVVLTLKGDVLAGAGTTDTFAITDTSTVSAVGVTTGNTLSGGAITKAGTGQALTIATQGTLTVSVVSGASGAPSNDQTAVVGQTNLPVFAMKLSAQKEAMKIRGLTLTASGTIGTVNDITNLRLTTDSGATVGSAIAQGVKGTNTIAFTWTAADQLLTVQPGTPVTVYATADVGGQGLSEIGDSFVFKINSSTTDITGIGAASAQAFAASGAPVATGKTNIVPFSVSIAADNTSGGSILSAGARLGTIKITNNGSSQITVSSTKFTLGGGLTNAATVVLKYSSQNSADYAANSGATTTLASTMTWNNLGITIDGGAYRYVSVYLNTNGTLVSGDNVQLSVAAVGDVTYSVVESDLGYDANASGSVDSTVISGLVSGDKANMPTISKP